MASKFDTQKSIDKLNSLIGAGKMTCPICHNNKFVVMDGFVLNAIQKEIGSWQMGGPSVPALMVVCNYCGFISQHALGALGSLSDPSVRDEGKND